MTEQELRASYAEYVERCKQNGVYPPYTFSTWKLARTKW